MFGLGSADVRLVSADFGMVSKRFGVVSPIVGLDQSLLLATGESPRGSSKEHSSRGPLGSSRRPSKNGSSGGNPCPHGPNALRVVQKGSDLILGGSSTQKLSESCEHLVTMGETWTTWAETHTAKSWSNGATLWLKAHNDRMTLPSFDEFRKQYGRDRLARF